MKKLIVILYIFLWAFQLYAQQDVHTRVHPRNTAYDQQGYADSIGDIVGQFVISVIFDVNKYDIRTTPQLREAIESIGNHRRALVQIWVKGSASPEGPSEWNQKLG